MMPDELFDTYEPAPPRAIATLVTIDNIHQLARRFREQGCQVRVEYDGPHQASATLHVKSEPNERHEIPGFEFAVTTGQTLALYQPHRRPLELVAGWNIVDDDWEFRRQWRNINGKP